MGWRLCPSPFRLDCVSKEAKIKKIESDASSTAAHYFGVAVSWISKFFSYYSSTTSQQTV
ncbi:hypothetical protein A7K93_08850 [Candidatus Methylacidiphilum fumarolicum]|uniref:Uncharacterized protein n=2 Tax=Candidatus Methylacidiphilum fumarolicum TaxID=591154 RepID=I0JXF0_METFB|nr:hypothetical protein A7K73_06390 [Candidatus Methylacidiphilum fumarolicum]CCG91919.1 hypothetical protein MFUM_270016 [Methylacidiphilum fumariolicum SolV]TFE72196.1 hypothetical protein A7K72_09110 [Candidatus Methylacidiphilum fumarolicum]TFE72337.1 hypothetical protein A7K93_08850 [Candidatus Methylacidiphilum fumarolicum]TFE77008.1 hypothetical protein A7D33_07305 [Candidatus Methylacidiphilum fumarolicum]